MRIARDLFVSFILSLGALCAFLLSQPVPVAEARQRAVAFPVKWHHGYYAPPLADETAPTVTLSVAKVADRANAAGVPLFANDLTRKRLMVVRIQGGSERAVVSEDVARDGFLFIPLWTCKPEPASIYVRYVAEAFWPEPHVSEVFVKVYDAIPAGECK